VSNSDGVAFTNNKPKVSLKAMLLPGAVKSKPNTLETLFGFMGFMGFAETKLVCKPGTFFKAA
jgi:hypothetical protein